MEEALDLFKKVYKQHLSVELCIAELKRKGVSQVTTTKVIMNVLKLSAVEADELVHNSIVWSH